MNNCGCKRPAVGPEPHAPVPLHGGGFVPNAIEWLKKKIDKLFGTAVFTVNGQKPEGGNVDVIVPSKVSELENDAGYLTEHQDVSGIAATAEEALSVATDAAENSVRIVNGKAPTKGNVKIVLDDLADKDGNIETTKTIMVSRDGGESHAAVALFSDLISEIDIHNNDVRAHTKLMATVARDYATKTEVDAKADKSALQAEVDRAQAAEAQLTTKANELDTAKADKSALNAHVNNKDNPHAVTADQVGAVPFVKDSRGNKTAVTIGSRKIDSSVGEDSFANGSDVTAAGRSSHAEGVETTAYDGAHAEGLRTTAMGYYSHAEGQNTTAVADGSHTDGIYSCTLRYDNYSYTWNGDGTKTESSPYTSHGEGTFNVNPAGGLGGFWIGEQTIEAIIAAAISGKANKSELPYSLVVKGIENGTVSLDDRADNYVDARALGSSNSLDIDFPVLVDGRSRDFVLAVECGENPPTISYAAFATIMAEDASTLSPEPGVNIYAFTEFKTNMFLAARKTVDTVVVNTPESSNQVLLAMQKRGIDTTNITDFGKVANTFGLGDTATPQDAIDAVMN